MRLVATLSLAGGALAWNNGVALTPPAGFANWNLFGCNYDDATFREIADAMVSTGLAAAGYEYMLVQECIVKAGARDPVTHVLQPDINKFPHGLADLAAYFHSKGLKAGIYTDVAHLTCAGYEGSGAGPDNLAGHWPLDALTFAQWGFDMIEADFCNTDGLPANYTAYALYKIARDAIAAATAATGRKIAFYQCNWGEQDPWLWAPEVSNLFRNTGDICGPGSISFDRILSNFDNTVIHSSTPGSAPGIPGTGIGAWNDPDMLGVGMPGITDAEGRSQFSLWAILSAPLFLGTDVRNMSAFTLATVSNAEALAINRDPLGVQAFGLGAGGPTPYQGGEMLNMTACEAGVTAAGERAPGATWTLGADGHVTNGDGADCLTVYGCDLSPLSPAFAYGCLKNTCGNQLWTWAPAGAPGTGQLRAYANDTNATDHMCLTGVAPAAGPDDGPFSQATVDVCDGRPAQQWAWGGGAPAAGGALSLPAFPAAAQCLVLPGPSDIYARSLAAGTPAALGEGQDVAVAVLNRGAGAAPGATIALSQFSFAPAQAVMVRDVWANATTGPFTGAFTTRAIASHETVLLRVYAA